MAYPRSPTHAAYGHALRALRSEAGFSQDRLALAADVDRAFVSGIERGEKNPSLTTLLKLVAAIGVPLSTLSIEAERRLVARPTDIDAR